MSEEQPEPVIGTSDGTLVAVERAERVPNWPFAVYALLWVAFAGVVYWRFSQVPLEIALFEAPEYALLLLVGIGLTVAGPLLSVLVWLLSYRRMEHKGAAFASSLFKGALVTFLGACAWWGILILLDQQRTGVML